MANGKDLELALRIKADLSQGQQALEGLEKAVEGVGSAASSANRDLNKLGADNAGTAAAGAQIDALGQAVAQAGAAAQTTSTQLNQIGESAEQQAARIRLMVEASLQQQAAADAMTASVQRSASVSDQANTSWQATAGAQTASANAYHNAERAVEQKAMADQKVVAAASHAAVAIEKESQELQQLLGRIDPVIRKLDELDEMEQQLRRSRAAGQIDIDTFDTFNGKLQEQRARLGGASDAMRAGAISAGQYQQAMRQLPMQITDITTSLASGMPLWMVAIQQGGQIKDSFGGIGNAGRALVSVLNPLTLAIAASTVAVGATALAYYQGSQEAADFREKLILTGNAAGSSSDRLMAMAASMDVVRGTQRQAASALAEVASTGKIAADQIMLVASTAVAMQLTTGRAVSETVAEFVKIADDPVQAVAKLNEGYNFLTAAVYEQIAALQEQGDEAGAAQLAMDTFASAMQERSNQITDNLGSLESAWKGIKSAASEAWDEMVGVGREQTLEDQLAALDRRSVTDVDAGSVAANTAILGPLGGAKELWDQLTPIIQGATEEGAEQVEQDRTRLKLQIQQRDTEAAWQAELAKLNSDSIQAQEEVGKLREQSLSRIEQKERAIAEYRANVEKIRAANPASALVSDDQVNKDLVAIENRYKERERKTRPRVGQELRAQESYLAQLERQAATVGMTTEQVRAYELAEKGLAGALLSRAQAAQVTLTAAERQKQVDQDLVQLADLRASLLRGEGDAAAASAIEIEKKYGALQKRLQAAGNTEGAGLVSKLINIEQAKAELDQLSQVLDGVFSEQSRREQTINTQQQAGLISELGARQQILDLNRLTAGQVEKLLPKMRALADVTGDPAAIERVKDLEARLGSLRIVANEVTNALKAGFETGLQGALQGLASGTMDLREAATAFIQDIASSMAGLASQKLAGMATDALLGSADDAVGGGATAAAIASASTAGATAMGTSIVTAGVQAGQAMAVAIAGAKGTPVIGGGVGNGVVETVGTIAGADKTVSAAGETAATSMGSAIQSAGSTLVSGIGGALSGGGNLLSSTLGSAFAAAATLLTSVFAAQQTSSAVTSAASVAAVAVATGGQVLGPGTGTSDSIPAWLSHTEFVTRAAVVTQPGALGFLHDFNARGMSALDDWARAVHHSTGGLAGVPAPALPRPAMGNGRLAEPGKAMGATVKNAQNFILVDDPSRITEAAFNTPQGVEGMVVMLSKDPAKFRSILGING